MILLLDTSILIDIERNHQPTILKLAELSKEHPLQPKISFITDFEFRIGLQRKTIPNKQVALDFLQKFALVLPTQYTSPLLANLKYKYEQKGIIFSLSDLLIASLAIENNLLLITKDKDFMALEELRKVII